MATANVQIKKVLVGRGNTATVSNYPGVRGEITMNTTTKTLHVHDGVTTGGWPLATEFYVANLLSEYGGVPGPQGPQGNIGAQGPTGATGAQGPQGIQGNVGPQGIQGNVGAQGAQGIQGNVGATGATGPQGIQGNVGATGSQGPQGAAGAKGDTGSQGIQGNTGAQGVSVTLRGNVSSPAALPVPGTAGDGYIVDSTGNLWFWNSTITAWADIGKIVGPEGPRGPQGIQGNTGPQGIQGIQGNVGATGPQGIQGATGATGAQGPQGIQGNTGAQGPQGIQGNIGPAGAQGATGAQGIQGNVGPQGPQGAAGSSANTGDFTFTHSNLATTTGANIRLTTNSNTFVLSSTGNLFLPNNMVFTSSPAVSGTGIVFGDGSYQYTAFTGTATATVANLDNNGSQVRLDSGGTLYIPNRITPIGPYGVAISPTNLSNTSLDWNFSAEGKVSKLYAPYSVSPVQSSIQFIGGTGNGQLGWDSGTGQTGLPYAESLFVASTGNLNVVGTNVHIRGGRTGVFDLGNQYLLGSGGFSLGELSGFTFIGAQFTSYYFVQSAATDYFTTLFTNNTVIDAGSYQGSMAITPVTRTSFGMATNNKYVFQIKVYRLSAIGNTIGVITDSGDFTQGLGAANFDYSVGFESYGVYNGPEYPGAPKFGVDDWAIVAVDRVNHKIWIKVLYNDGTDGESAWNSDPTADPTTNTGGFDLPTFGGAVIYPAVTSVNGNNYTDLGWTFGTDGNLTLPNGQSIGSGSLDGIKMTTDRGTVLFGNSPECVPTLLTHFHIMKDDPANVDLFLGDDNNYVKLPGNGETAYGVEIGTNVGDGANTWRFGTDGVLTLPGNIQKSTDASIVIGSSVVNFSVEAVDELVPPGGVWRLFFNDSQYPTLGTTVQIGDTVTTSWGTLVTATIVDIQQDSGSWQIHVDQDITVGFNDFDTVTFSSVANKTWTFGANGNLTLPTNGNITFANGVNILSTITGGGTSSGNTLVNGSYTVALQANGVLTLGGTSTISSNGEFRGNLVNFGQNNSTLAGPAAGGASDRIRLWDFNNSNPSDYNYAIGAEADHVWFTTDHITDTGGFKFYGQGHLAAKIGGAGTITLGDNSTGIFWSNGDPYSTGGTTTNTIGAIVGNVGGDAALGALWFNTEDSRTYVRAGGYWVDANPPVAPAPSFYTGNLEFSGETIISDTKSWTFGTDGNLVMPQGSAFYSTYFDVNFSVLSSEGYGTIAEISNNGLTIEATSVMPNNIEPTALFNTPILEGEKKMFSIRVDRVANNRNGWNGIGIGTHGMNISQYLGSDNTYSVGFYEQGAYYGNSQGYGAPASYTSGDIIDVAVDNDNFRIWMRVNGGYWNNRSDADPATNAYGYETGEFGTVYPGVTPTNQGSGDPGNKFTLRTTPIYSVPEGFEFYGAESYNSTYIKFGNNDLTVDATGNLLVNGSLVTGSGGGGTGNTLVNGGYTVALEANGVLTLGGTATISNNGEFRIWADNDITVYRNGRDGYGVTDGNINNYTNNGLRTVTNSRGFELKTGNLVIPSKIVTSGNVLEIGSNSNPYGSVRINSTNNAWVFTGGNIAEEFGYFTIDSGYESGTPGLIVRGSEMVHRMLYSSGNIASAITLTQPNVPTVEYPPTVNISLYDDSSTPTATTWTFGLDGNLTFSSGMTILGNTDGTQGIIATGNSIVGVVSSGLSGASALEWVNDLTSPTAISAVVVNSPYATGAGAVQISTGAANPFPEHNWFFENDGNLTLPTDGAINFANGINILNTISSIGNITVSGSDITGTGSNVTITADTTDYVFYANGTVRTDGALTIVVPSGTPSGVANWAGGGGWNQAFYSNIATTGGTGTGLTVDVAAGGGGYIVIGTISINNPGSGYTDGDVITINNENNIPGTFTVVVVSKNWEFDGTGNITLPNDGTIRFANGVPILSTINGLTSISSSVTTGLYSDASGDYQYGTLDYSYAVNNNNGQFSIEYSKPLVYGNVDISVGNVTTAGTANVANLIISGAVPGTLIGSTGDTAGMIRVDSNYIYYCTSTFTPASYTVGWEGAVGNVLFIAKGDYPTPQVGWTVTHSVTTFTIDTVTSAGSTWRIDFTGTAYGSASGGTATLTNPNPATIWTRTPLAATTYANSNVAAYLVANPQSGTYSNTNVAAYLTTGQNVTTANLTITGNVVQQGAYYETFSNVTNSGGNLVCNFANSATFYATLTANVTANIYNVTATAGRVTSVTLIVDQGATPYGVANIQINGGGIQTIKWAGGTGPNTGTASNTDVMSFSLISLNGTAWRVLGQISNYG